MTEELDIEHWLEYWNLYDKACWSDYLTRPAIKKAYKKSEYNLRSYLHDQVLVKGIEQIETNLEQIDGNSKFLYWFRFREEFLIITADYQIDYSKIDDELKPKYNEYIQWQQGGIIKPKFLPDYEYFKWFYIGLCSLKGDAEIYFNEMLFNLPVFNKIELNKRNLELLEADRKEKIVNIYNYGNIDTIINNLNEAQDNSSKSKLTNVEIVESIILNFKRQIEDNGLFKLLYEGKEKKLRHENSAQQLFFSVAQIFCLANDLDVSPETNSGAGSVDFKFSKGAFNKINVEIKYSNHTRLKHGLETQLKKYDKAEQSCKSYFLIVQVGNHDRLLNEIVQIDKKVNPKSNKVKIVDGRPKTSASIK